MDALQWPGSPGARQSTSHAKGRPMTSLKKAIADAISHIYHTVEVDTVKSFKNCNTSGVKIGFAGDIYYALIQEVCAGVNVEIRKNGVTVYHANKTSLTDDQKLINFVRNFQFKVSSSF